MQDSVSELDKDFALRQCNAQGNQLYEVQDFVVDQVTAKLGDLESSELKAVRLVVKHSIAARRRAVGSQQTISSRHLPRNWFWTTILFLLWIYHSNYFQFVLRFIMHTVVYFAENTDGKNELLSFWLCFNDTFFCCDFASNNNWYSCCKRFPVLSFMTKAKRT